MNTYDFVKITGASVIGLVAIIVMRKVKDEYALFISLFICIWFMVISTSYVRPVFEYIMSLKALNENTTYYVSLIMKCSSCAMLCSFGSELCRDCGESSLGSKIELCGKCIILSLCLPLIKTVFDYVTELVL